MSKIFATIDLGSNSFHLMIARVSTDKRQKIIVRAKQQVKLRDGIDANGSLTSQSKLKALACFLEFAKTLKLHKVDHVKIVGTYTLRAAVGIDDFLLEAKKILGHKINVIDGEEEARLIYVGATRNKIGRRQKLLIDIGGGSTELIIGKGKEILALTSLNIGCVSVQTKFFANGALSETNFKKAIVYAKKIITPQRDKFLKTGFDVCLGSSGTVRSIASVLLRAGWSRGIIDMDGLIWLRLQLQDLKKVDNLQMPGLRTDREGILPGGLAVLTALFEVLKLKKLSLSRGAIREGVLFELIEEHIA